MSQPSDRDREGHPLPSSEEARGYQIPEHLQRRKGLGDDAPGEDGGEDPHGSDKESGSPQSDAPSASDTRD